jgi:exosortase E/protease (VPEID-CTERM system)
MVHPQPVQSEHSESSGRRGLILLLVAVVAEYLILSVSFDASPWLIHVDLIEQLRGVKYVGPAVLASIAGVFALGGSNWVKAVGALAAARPAPSVRRTLIVAHVALLCALYALSLHIFVQPFKVHTNAGLWIAAWTLLGALTIGCLIAAFIDVRSIGRLLRQNALLVVGAAALTALAWQAGSLASTFWHHTSRPMMRLLGVLARYLFEGGEADLDQRVLTTSRFAVEIAPACSGYEGIGLILVFLGGFLLIARDRLMFPKVLIVLPIGVAFVWVANLVRILALMAVGHYISPTLAVNGFHAYAGWILFCATALTMVYWTESKFSAAPEQEVEKTFDTATTAYLGPLLAVIAASLITGLFASDIDLFYFVRVAAGATVLWLCRRYYADLRGMPSVVSVVIGVVIAVLWMLVVQPPEGGVSPLARELDTLTPVSRALWITGRLIGFIVIAPLAEELAFRGHLLRWIQARDFETVAPRQWNVQAVLISSLLFGAIHADLIAGTVAGLLLAFAKLHRGKLIDAVAAHAVANAVLAVVGLARGAYWLW